MGSTCIEDRHIEERPNHQDVAVSARCEMETVLKRPPCEGMPEPRNADAFDDPVTRAQRGPLRRSKGPSLRGMTASLITGLVLSSTLRGQRVDAYREHGWS